MKTESVSNLSMDGKIAVVTGSTQGLGEAMLLHLIAAARARGYRRLSLETGSGVAFEPAIGLYRKHGFVECGPFADYSEDPFSTFMTLAL